MFQADIFEEVTLTECSVAERSTKNVNCSFSVSRSVEARAFGGAVGCAELALPEMVVKVDAEVDVDIPRRSKG